MEYQKILQKRKTILNSVQKTTVSKTKSMNVQSQRYCAVCGKQLTKYLRYSHHYMTVVKHYHYFIAGVLSGSMCYDPHSCYQRINKRKG